MALALNILGECSNSFISHLNTEMVTRVAWTYFLGLPTGSTNLLFEAVSVRDNISNVSDWSLRFLTPVVDSWFGIVTTSVQQTRLQVIAPPKGSFGRVSELAKAVAKGT